MGLLQDIEGLFGFGKKSTQTAQDATAVTNAITVIEGFVNQVESVVTVVTPFLSEVPALSGFLAIAKTVGALAQSALTELKSLVPAPAAPPTTPAK